MTRITLSPSGKSVEAENGETVLSALERAGYALPNNCRAGACGECKVKVLSGSFDQGLVLDMALSPQERIQGFGLMCMAKPTCDDLTIEWGTADAKPKLFPPKKSQPFVVTDRIARTDRVAELHALSVAPDQVRIGAAVPLSRLEREIPGVFPALDQMLPWFAARQVKNRATLGGNLGSASPIGDLLPWLLAHDAVIELAGPGGLREVAIDGFFEAYRKTQRQPDELIVAVRVPRLSGPQAAYKVAKRQTDDISIVAAVYALALDADGRVARARLAYGGVAAVPLRARRAEAALLGRMLDEDTAAGIGAILREEFAPLDDHRASADYRRELCASLFAKFVEEGGR